MKLILGILILALIGIFRVILEVKLGINLDGKWFSYDGDILFAMAAYPIYLCFFLFMCLHILFKLFNIKNSQNKLISFLFFIQFMHLLIPWLDYLGFEYGIPYNTTPYLNAQSMAANFTLNPFSSLPSIYYLPVYFTPLILFFTIVTTFGINTIWLLTGIAFVIFLKKLKVSAPKITLLMLIIFQIIYWPVYKYYFVFDGLFRRATGLNHYTHYGYGIYFLTFGFIGIAYFLRVSRKEK